MCMRDVLRLFTTDTGCAVLTAPGDFALKHASWMVPSQYKPGEVARMEWQTVQQGPPWAVDSWGLGCMMQVSGDGNRVTGRSQTCSHTARVVAPE